MYVCMYVGMYVCMYVCSYVIVRFSMYTVCMYVCVYAGTQMFDTAWSLGSIRQGLKKALRRP